MVKTRNQFLKFTLKCIVASIIAICTNSCQNEIIDISKNYDGIVSNKKQETIYIYEKDFVTEELGNWTNGKATSQANGLILKKRGSGIYLKNYYSLNHRTARLCFTLSDDTKFCIGTIEAIMLNKSINTERPLMNNVTFDAKTQSITYENTSCEYKFKSNTIYEFALKTSDRSYSFTLINKTDKDTLELGTFAGECNDLYGIYLEDGTSPCLKKFTVETDRSPYIIFCGNSITHGTGTIIVDNQPIYAYPFIVGEKIGKPYLLSARNGSTIHHILGIQENSKCKYTGRLFTEIIPLKPKYAMITIGTNEGNTKSNINLLIKELKDNGITPILNNIPFKLEKIKDKWVEKSIPINKLIENAREENDLNGAKFDIATSIGKKGIECDTSCYAKETGFYIHPNNIGHMNMFDQIMQDCPELFQ